MAELRRPLDTDTLCTQAKYLASMFGQPDRANPKVEGRFLAGPSYVAQELYNYTFKDVHDFMVEQVRDHLGKSDLSDFDKLCADRFTPRDDALFEELLARKLAINPMGEHIPGKIGTTVVDSRVVGKRLKNGMPPRRFIRKLLDAGVDPEIIKRLRDDKFHIKNMYWPIYEGESIERAAESGVADELPEGAQPLSAGAVVVTWSNEYVLTALDAGNDLMDEGTGAGVLKGRTGAAPADADTAATGSVLFTNVGSDPFFNAGSDAVGSASASAASISDDTSADATGTLGYVRGSATNDGSTPLDDHFDANVGTSGAAFNFNTLSIVAGATVSITSLSNSISESYSA